MDTEKESQDQLELQSQQANSSTEDVGSEKTAAHEHRVAGKDHALDGIELESGNPEGISNEHRDYLISRHGTADLIPLPTMDPADPLNWPAWKVCYRPAFAATSC